MEHKVIGKDTPRVDAIDKVTGHGVFIADIKLPQMLSAVVIRSGFPHAVIESIEMQHAVIEGVRAVVTGRGGLCITGEGKEFVENQKDYLIGACIKDQPPLARGKVRYVGEPVAAVVANSVEVAAEAAEKIKVNYLPLPHVLDAKEAIKEDAPLIHEDLRKYEVLPTFKPEPGTNVYHHYTLLKGDAERALKEADFMFEHEFVYPHISHAQMEPHGCIAHWERNGELAIYTSSQSPWCVRTILSATFDMPHHKIKVTVPYVGGGFGGKSDVTIEPLTAYMASFVPGYPVRYILTREEMFTGSLLGRGCRARITTGMSKTGKIVAIKTDLLFQGGGYGDCSINIVTAAGHNCTGPYEIAHIRADSRGVYTNTPYIGAFRGYGHPEVHWMMDRNLDIIAHRLNMDPYQLKLKNLLKPGSRNALNQLISEHDGRLKECVDFVYQELKNVRHSNRLAGYGFTPIMKSPVIANNAASCATLRFNEDASVTISISGIDMGQGSTTALSQIAAEALMMPLDRVRITRTVATDYTPYEWQTVASRTTWTVGNAIIRAVDQAIFSLKNLAASLLGASVDRLEYDGEKVHMRGDIKAAIPLRDLCMGHIDRKGNVSGGPVLASGYYIPPHLTFPDPKTGQGNLASEWTFGCQGVAIEITPWNGKIEVIKMVTALDAGKVIHPTLARGQVVGAMVQALGAAMAEAIVYSPDGRVLNNSLTDYKIPSPEDFANAEIVVQFFETPFPEGPYGARCIAEHGAVGMAAALGNAVFNATGIEFYELPITSEVLLKKLKGTKEVTNNETAKE